MVHELYSYLRVSDSARAIDFYRKAFGATEIFRLTEPSGRIGHAELDFNGTTLMVSDEFPEYGMKGPQPGDSSPVSLHLHVDNADRLVQQALNAGATLHMAPQDQFYGERTGVVNGIGPSPTTAPSTTSCPCPLKSPLLVNTKPSSRAPDGTGEPATIWGRCQPTTLCT